MAVSTSIIGSLGCLRFIKGLSINPYLKPTLNKISPFVGVVSANLINLFFSKYKDFEYIIYIIYKDVASKFMMLNQENKFQNKILLKQVKFYII
jgi:hypothetical protein